MTGSPRVLIVDASRESREVLRMLLERRGAATIEAERPDEAAQMADQLLPNLIVLDAESDVSTTGEPTKALHIAAGRSHIPIVILGKLRQPPGEISPGENVAKPYHYADLIRKIDGLLAAA